MRTIQRLFSNKPLRWFKGFQDKYFLLNFYRMVGSFVFWKIYRPVDIKCCKNFSLKKEFLRDLISQEQFWHPKMKKLFARNCWLMDKFHISKTLISSVFVRLRLLQPNHLIYGYFEAFRIVIQFIFEKDPSFNFIPLMIALTWVIDRVCLKTKKAFIFIVLRYFIRFTCPFESSEVLLRLFEFSQTHFISPKLAIWVTKMKGSYKQVSGFKLILQAFQCSSCKIWSIWHWIQSLSINRTFMKPWFSCERECCQHKIQDLKTGKCFLATLKSVESQRFVIGYFQQSAFQISLFY